MTSKMQNLNGKIKWFNIKKGFGFITIDKDSLNNMENIPFSIKDDKQIIYQDIFFHYSSIQSISKKLYKYKYVFEELSLWYPKVKKGGIIIGDDAVDIDENKRDVDNNIFIEWGHNSNGMYGVKKAFEDFIKIHKCFGVKYGTQYMIKKV